MFRVIACLFAVFWTGEAHARSGHQGTVRELMQACTGIDAGPFREAQTE